MYQAKPTIPAEIRRRPPYSAPAGPPGPPAAAECPAERPGPPRQGLAVGPRRPRGHGVRDLSRTTAPRSAPDPQPLVHPGQGLRWSGDFRPPLARSRAWGRAAGTGLGTAVHRGGGGGGSSGGPRGDDSGMTGGSSANSATWAPPPAAHKTSSLGSLEFVSAHDPRRRCGRGPCVLIIKPAVVFARFGSSLTDPANSSWDGHSASSPLLAAVCRREQRSAITSARAESEGFRNPKVFGTVREDCSRNCCCTQAILTPLWLSLVATQVRRCCPRNPNGAPDHDLKLLLPSEHHFRDYVEINKVGRILCGAREQETMSKRPFPSSS